MSNSSFARTFIEIKRNGWRSYFLVFTLTVNFIALGFFLTLTYSAFNLVDYFKQKPEAIGFFKQNIAEEDIFALKKDLEGLPYVVEVTYTSKEQATKNFIDDNKDNQEIIEALTADILPAHLNIKTNNLEKMDELISRLENEQVIDEVGASREIISALQKIIFIIQLIGFVILGVFTANTFFIVLLIVGLSVHLKKDEIEIMQLIGASRWYIQSPYLLQGVIYSVTATLIASVVILFVLYNYYSSLMQFILGENVEITEITFEALVVGVCMLIVFGLLVTFVGSTMALRRYLHKRLSRK